MARKMKDIPEDELRAMLAERFELDVSPDADDATYLNAMSERLGELAARDVDAAIASGKILAEHRTFWVNSFKNNHIPARAALDALAPAPAVRRSDRGVPMAMAANTIRALSSAPSPENRGFGSTPQEVMEAITNGEPLTPPPGVSAKTLQDAAADAALWELGATDMVEPPPQPKWWTLFPPEQV